MRAQWLLIATLPLALVACDSDGDGLSNKLEAELGTNPDSVDTDGDQISDFDEYEAGTDPLKMDTDGDGFVDGRELADGTDATDPMSYDRNTPGDWPNLSGYASEDVAAGWAVGDRFADVETKDQFGEYVSLYDFWGNVAMIDFSAGWCGPCRGLATTAEDEYRKHADEGFIIIHMMIDDNTRGGGITDAAFLADWADTYALTFPVTDAGTEWGTIGSGLSGSGLYDGGIPFLVLLDQGMVIQDYGRDVPGMMTKVESMLAE